MKEDDTKQCPYCAETIKAAAIVCRYCGRDLETTKMATDVTTTPQPSEKKKNRSRAKELLVFIILMCCGLTIMAVLNQETSLPETANNSSNEIAASDNDVKPTSEPTATPIPQPTTPPIEEILATVEGMTDAQRNNYNESLQGSRVGGWEGEVSDVDEGEILGGFTVYVDMASSQLGSEVHFDVSEDIALSLNKGQTIRFSGDVKLVSDFLGETIFLENITVESIE